MILNIFASGDSVIMETAWSGTASDWHPMLKPDERQSVREIVIYRFRDGQTVETRDYAIVVPAPWSAATLCVNDPIEMCVSSLCTTAQEVRWRDTRVRTG